MKDYVEKLLKDYNNMKQEFELSSCKAISDEEILEGLLLPGVSGNPRAKNGISNKTANLAISYPQRIEKIRSESLQEVYSRLSFLKMTMQRLEYCLSKIDAHYAAVLKEHYFDGYSWRELATLKNTTSKTLMKYRDEAIARLEIMYTSLENVVLLPFS